MYLYHSSFNYATDVSSVVHSQLPAEKCQPEVFFMSKNVFKKVQGIWLFSLTKTLENIFFSVLGKKIKENQIFLKSDTYMCVSACKKC